MLQISFLLQLHQMRLLQHLPKGAFSIEHPHLIVYFVLYQLVVLLFASNTKLYRNLSDCSRICVRIIRTYPLNILSITWSSAICNNNLVEWMIFTSSSL